jgi:hypothetical protein
LLFKGFAMFKLWILPFLFWALDAGAQSLSSFFHQEGCELVAALAHPSNTYRYAKYEVRAQEIWVDIYYEEYNTELKIKRKGNFFSGIEVVYDDDWVNPFAATGIIKDMVWDFINDSSDRERKENFEQLMGKKVAQMNGKELASLILTLAWLAY